MDYLLGRQLTLGSIRKYRLGYAPGGWHDLHHHLKNKGFTETEMAEAALIVHKGSSAYDKFRERVMFPIIDIRGNVIGFGGRTLEKTASAKYINTDETLVFHKREKKYIMRTRSFVCFVLKQSLVKYPDSITLRPDSSHRRFI